MAEQLQAMGQDLDAVLDQVLESYADIAHKYYEHLKTKGFDHPAAVSLTAAFIHSGMKPN